MRVVVSACLLGRACRYDGASKPKLDALARLAPEAELIPVCPEELGGLGTPRPGAELRGGDGAAVWRGEASVRREADDGDVTAAFCAGAERAWALAGAPDLAVLKARSPSCGVGTTHIDGAVRRGDGVFAALLRARGVPLVDDEASEVSEGPPPSP
ncbi:DUF523 domain-containing protein [Myxococcota bacterium]|nr:DUF523 domain-containing protein [Myxococcota bacterium]